MLAASFQDCVLIDIATQVVPEMEVVFLDTQYHFAETLWYVEQVRERYDLNLRVISPQIAPDNLWQIDPDECCAMRKVEPLARALEGKSAWLTGLRRDEAPTRANAPIVGFDIGRGIVKVNPIANWTHDEIDGYVADRGLPVHPLRDKGYPSIGCWPCTNPVKDGDDPRAGRWTNSGKLECGLHGWTPSACLLSVHEVASSGFGAEADAYERARPSYPPDAVAWIVDALGIAPGRDVADVAAGTGKFTRLIEPTGAWIVAVEPVDAMRARLPRLPTAAATAERLPFRDESLDAITVAQAFHWFDATATLEEFHRVLRPGGRLALIWNARDRSVPWVDEVWSIMDRVEKRAPWRAHEEWRESAFVETSWFGPLHEATFHHEQVLSPADVVERVRSVSHVAVLPAEQREAVLDEVRTLLRDDPATAGRDELALPYRVDAYWTERT